MRALLGNLPVDDDDDAAGGADGGKAMGDDERRAVLGQLVKGVLDLRLGHGIERRGCLVKDQDGRIFQEDAGDGDALLLPARQERAALADVGVKAVGHRHDVVVNFGALRRGDDLVHACVRAAVADVLEDGIGEEEDVLLDDADGAAEALLRDGADVLPVDADRAASYIVEARNELAERGLASAGRPDNRNRLAGVGMERDVVQNVQLALVGEADVVDVNRAVDLRKLLRIGCIIQRGFGAHDLDEALESCRAVGEHLGEVRQLPDGVDKGRDIERERQQVDHVHASLHDERTAHRHNRDGEDAEEKLHAGVENAHLLIEILLGALVHLVRAAELLRFDRFVGERLGCAHAGEAGFNVGIDDADLLLDETRGAAHRAAARHDDEYGDRDEHADDEREPPFDCEHDDECAGDRDDGDEQVLGAVVRQLSDLKEVGGQAAHQMAGAVAVVKVEAKRLHVAKERLPDVGLDADAERMAPVGDDIIEQRTDDVGQHDDAHNNEKRLVLQIGQERVDRLAGDDRIGQVDQRNK